MPPPIFDVYLAARIDQAPDLSPMRHTPETIVSAAFSNMVPNAALPLSGTLDVQLPESSPPRPLTFARHAPDHWSFAFAADHPPNAAVFPCASVSVHVPVTALCAESGTAVHVPMNVAGPFVALHVPDLAPGTSRAESSRTTP